MKKYLIIFMVIQTISQALFAQCVIEPIDLSTRVNSSDLIVEATVVQQESFIEDSDGHIYTANYLNIYKVFKGETDIEEVVLISPGGQFENIREHVSPSISVELGTTGIFFLYNSPIIGDASFKNYKPFSGPQACIYYHLNRGTANDAFNTYTSIEEEIYMPIEQMLGNSFVTIKKANHFKSVNDKSSTVITGIFPKTVTAGTKHVLTIKGNDFESTKGTGIVQFKNASTGSTFISPHTSEYISWSDTMIVVHVPNRAGSGIVSVQQNGLGITTGLVVNFAQLNYTTHNSMIPPFHKDNDNNGQFVWSMSNQFHGNNGARTSYERAMASWSDNTCINWINGPAVTRNADKRDGINNVRWADTGELEQGVLAITRNYWDNCDGNTAWPLEIDLSFDPDKDWNVSASSPTPSQYDLESIAVHELGHAHELGHVIDEADFMHATIGPGDSKRNLVDNNIEAGLYIMKYSVQPFSCGDGPMIGKSGCTIPVGIDRKEDLSSIKTYPNPFSSALHIDNIEGNELRIGIYNVLGNRIKEFQFFEGTYSVTWTVPDDLPNGLYFLKNETSGILITKLLHSK